MKTSVQITRAELNTAMEHFFARGGFIERIETEVNGLRAENYEEWLGEDTSNSTPEGADLNRFSLIPDFSAPDC
jgi:hypothetical protein